MAELGDLSGISNEDLMAAIAHEKKHIVESGKTRGPRQHQAYVEAHIYPALTAYEQERNRRMKARIAEQSEDRVQRHIDQGTINPMFGQGGE